MADLPKLERPTRRIPQSSELGGIGMMSRGIGQAGARYNAEAMTVKAPQIDVRGFLDESRGLAQVGQAVQQIGSATRALAVEQARAVADRQARDSRRSLGAIETKMGGSLAAEPDEEKFPDILEKHLEQARAAINDTPMMADAKLAASEYLADWEVQQRHNVTMLQTRRSFDRARESLQADVIEAVDRKDFASARAALGSREAGLYMGEDRVASQLGEITRAEEAHVVRLRREEIETDAAATPDMWLERNPEPGDMDVDDWQAGQAMARRVISTRVSDAADQIADGLVTGDIKTEKDIEAVAAGRLKPAALAQAKETLQKMQSDAWRAENLGPAAVTKNFGLLLSEVEKYDKTKDPDGSDYADLVWKIKTLMPEELRGEITQPLSRKWNPGNGPEAPEPLKGFVRETLRNWYGDGKFGQTQKRVPLTPDDPGWYQGTTQTKMVEDPPGRDAAAARRGEAELEMAKWLRENPNATIKEAKEQLLRSSSAALLPGDVNALMRKPAPAPPAADTATRIKEIGMRFGGVSVPPTGDLGTPKLTVFGGKNDPDDNGLSAFGGPTGPGGREGVAVPEKILRHFYGNDRSVWEQVKVEATLPDGTKRVLPIADLGTAEWVWEKNGKPVMDLTPGAVGQLGGDVIYGRDGTLKGISGLKGVRFRLLPISDQTPPFSE